MKIYQSKEGLKQLFLIKLINFIKGYKIFIIEGPFCERFLNICSYRKIYLWDIKRLGEEKMKMCVSLSGFEQFDDIASRTSSTYKLVSERGLPRFARTYRKRTGFAIGFIVFLIAIWVSSFFIWGIEFQADENVDIALAMQILEESDIKVGKFKIGLDKENARINLMSGIDNLAWAGISINGTKAIVTMKKRIELPERVDTSTPCNIVARKAGVVESATTKLGEQLVQKGQAIAKGQLLVSGSIQNSLGVRFLHCNSEIIARTWLEAGVAIIQIDTQKIYTGEKKTFGSLKLFSWEIPLYFNKNLPFDEFEEEKASHQAKLSKNLLLPFYYNRDMYVGIDFKKVELSFEEGQEIALNTARNRLKAQLGDGELVYESYELIPIETGETVLKLTWECLENIGEKMPIITN